jgi:hypothetical protein
MQDVGKDPAMDQSSAYGILRNVQKGPRFRVNSESKQTRWSNQVKLNKIT